MDIKPYNIKNSFSKRNFLLAFLIFISFFVTSAYFLISFDAFEKFFEFSRNHEDYELDEMVLILFAFLVSLSFALFYLTFVFAKKVIEFTNFEIEQQKRVQTAQKLQSMGSMLGGLAHSLNNHLVPIITLSKMVKDDIPKDNPNYEDMNKILEASYGLKDILKQVLNFTREDNSNLSNSCQIDETLINTLKLSKTIVPSSVSFETDIENSALIVPISRVNIEIIIFNLITNSVHALEEKKVGYIKVTATSSKDKSAIIIKVKDSGQGISKDKKELIFDPFYTTKEQGKGTGLGLSETFGIIKNAGGKIKVDSIENEFTEFTLEIPTIKEFK